MADIQSWELAELFCLRQEGHLLCSRKGGKMKKRGTEKRGSGQMERASSKGRCQVIFAGM